jgi:hypothetical protein
MDPPILPFLEFASRLRVIPSSFRESRNTRPMMSHDMTDHWRASDGEEAQPQDLSVTPQMQSEIMQHSDLSPPTKIQQAKLQKQTPPRTHALTTSQVLFSWRWTATFPSRAKQHSAATVFQPSAKTPTTLTRSDLWAQALLFVDSPQPAPQPFQELTQPNVCSSRRASSELTSQTASTLQFILQWRTSNAI